MSRERGDHLLGETRPGRHLHLAIHPDRTRETFAPGVGLADEVLDVRSDQAVAPAMVASSVSEARTARRLGFAGAPEAWARCSRSSRGDMLMEHQQPEQSWLTPGRPVTYHRSVTCPVPIGGRFGLGLAAAALAVVKAEWLRGFGGARRENATMLDRKRPS